MKTIGNALAHLADSKTYVFLILFALLALVACIVADSIFHRDLWGRLFDLLLGQSVTGGGRAAVVDGAPKIAAAWRDPNSAGANPPPSVSTPVPTYSVSTTSAKSSNEEGDASEASSVSTTSMEYPPRLET